MAFDRDRAIVRDTIARDPACAGLDLSDALAEMEAAQEKNAFLRAVMALMALAGNGHSRLIPNAAIEVWPVRIVARSYGFGVVHGGRLVRLDTVNDVPVGTLLDRFRPLLAGTAARQSVIGAILMAWPGALGANTVAYGMEGGSIRFGPDDLTPALPLYPTSDTGMIDADTDDLAGDGPVVWDDTVWRVRIARLDVPLPEGISETLATRPAANILFDLRGNTGGSFLRMLPIIDDLRARWRGTRIAVQVDRFTFSAAIVTAVLLQHHLGARLFGEPMGDGLRFWAEGDLTHLPDSGAHLRWSSAWHDWETGQADDTTPPEIARHMVATGPLQITPCRDGSTARAWVAG